jgi:nucleotide-binding universal stress UspA family protein
MCVHLRVHPISQERATVQVPGEPRHDVPLAYEETTSEELVYAQEIVDAAVAEIKSLVTSPDVTITGRVVVDNRVDDGILKVADETRTDIIVIGTRGLSTLRGAILGSVSHALIEKAHCPVLIVK